MIPFNQSIAPRPYPALDHRVLRSAAPTHRQIRLLRIEALYRGESALTGTITAKEKDMNARLKEAIDMALHELRNALYAQADVRMAEAELTRLRGML